MGLPLHLPQFRWMGGCGSGCEFLLVASTPGFLASQACCEMPSRQHQPVQTPSHH